MAEGQQPQDSAAQVSEAQIAVHWREEENYPPPAAFVAQANASDRAIFERFTEDKFPDCFKEYADLLDWDRPWHTTLDTSNPPFWKWFVGGWLNASYNCVDRHAAAHPGKTAIIFVPEPESDQHLHISYAQLLRQVNEFASLLRDFLGVTAGDRVTLHMPMVPELAVTMLACSLITRSRQTRRSRLPARKARRWTRYWCGGATRASTPRTPRWPAAVTTSWTRSSARTRARSSSRCRCRPRRRYS